MASNQFKIIFWGVRGSRPIPGHHTLKYGGNTSCVSIEIGERLFIFDAGTGICNLGQELIKRGKKIVGDIFITHTHWDHIQGFPFFTPAFIKGNSFTLYGQSKMNINFSNLMRGQMLFPHFPVSLEKMGAYIEFREIDSCMSINLGNEIILKTAHNNHPGECLSYRIEHEGRSCCYVTDTEHYSVIDYQLEKFIRGADVVIYDANFTNEEYKGYSGFDPKTGWGHSTWQEGIKLVQAAGAKKLVIFHHATHRTDSDLDEIESKAQEQYSNCIVAKEGMVICL